MGLAERRAVKAFQDNQYPEFKRQIDEAAGFDLPIEVHWDSLSTNGEGYANILEDTLAKVYFIPLVDALKAITIDEAALTYQPAYNEALVQALRASYPRFGWHLLAEAPGSLLGRLSAQSGLPAPLCNLALDVSAGDETAALELLGWLRGRVSPEGKGPDELLEGAREALGGIGAEPDDAEVEGRHRAEALLAQGELVRHVAGGAHFLCPTCLRRWPGEAPESCPQCGGPLVRELPLGDDEAQRSMLDALNARVQRHLRTVFAPDFEWGQVQDG